MILEHYEITLIGHKRVSRIEFYKDGDLIRWRCLAPNGVIIGWSFGTFTNVDEAKRNTFMLASTLAAFKFKTND